MANLEHPWQSGPTEIIEHALAHLNRTSDLDQRIGFLLLDAGVETLLKTFLLLPTEVTGVEMSYGKRKQAAEGSFHALVLGVEEAAADRLEGINLAHMRYYHGIRNKLYHEGDGVTVDAGRAEAYALLAVQLLDRLLGIDIERSLRRGQRVLLDEYGGGSFKCAICAERFSIPMGPVYVLAETLEPVCFPCGHRNDGSELLASLLGGMWSPYLDDTYIDLEHYHLTGYFEAPPSQ